MLKQMQCFSLKKIVAEYPYPSVFLLFIKSPIVLQTFLLICQFRFEQSV